MKKIALVLLLVIGMTLSFLAIGLMIMFTTGAVKSIDEAKQLLSGQLPGGESAYLKPDEVAQDDHRHRPLHRGGAEVAR